MSNFAYDPVNYEHFEQLNIVEFFFDVLYASDQNAKEFEYALGGVCNLASGNILHKHLM